MWGQATPQVLMGKGEVKTGLGAFLEDSAAAAGLRPVIVNRMGLPTGFHTVVSEVSADLLLLWLGRT